MLLSFVQLNLSYKVSIDSVYCYYQEVCLSFFSSDYNVFTNWVARNAVIAISLDVDTEVGKMQSIYIEQVSGLV